MYYYFRFFVCDAAAAPAAAVVVAVRPIVLLSDRLVFVCDDVKPCQTYLHSKPIVADTNSTITRLRSSEWSRPAPMP